MRRLPGSSCSLVVVVAVVGESIAAAVKPTQASRDDVTW